MAALIGPSGGGKSTTAALIDRFFDVTEGSILIGGVDIRDIPKEELNKMIAYVFQDNKLLKMSIRIILSLQRAMPQTMRLIMHFILHSVMILLQSFQPELIQCLELRAYIFQVVKDKE